MSETRQQLLHLAAGAVLAFLWGPVNSILVYFIREQAQHRGFLPTVKPRRDMGFWFAGSAVGFAGRVLCIVLLAGQPGLFSHCCL